MGLARDVEVGLRALAAQVTRQGLELKAAQESIAELAAAVRELQEQLAVRDLQESEQ